MDRRYSLKSFTERLQNYDYIALANVDAKFIQRYGSVFSTPPKADNLYRKMVINNQLTMIEIHLEVFPTFEIWPLATLQYCLP